MMTSLPRWLGLIVSLAVPVQAAAEACRQALLIALDVSLSVDTGELALQRDGLASALLSPGVADALLWGQADGDVPGIEIAVFEWSANFDQAMIVDWTRIDTLATLGAVAARIRAAPPVTRPSKTGLGSAMLWGMEALGTRGHCGQWTLDISGDGRGNTGVEPGRVRARLEGAGITVNALAIGADAAGAAALARYFEDNVLTGPGAFALPVAGFASYAEAMERKLLRELVPAFARAGP